MNPHTRQRTRMVYGLLLVIWGVVVAWQIAEHDRVRDTERTLLINRSRDITTTLGLVIRSQRRFGSIVSQERLESALSELVKAGELSSVALLNATGEVVVSAGPPIDLDPKGTARHGQRWEHRSVTIVNPIDLGTTITHEGETNRPIIVLPRRDSSPPPPPPPHPHPHPHPHPWVPMMEIGPGFACLA